MIKTKLRIHTWPESILRKKCKKVEVVDDTLRTLFDEMYCLMLTDKGVGLAANQVGLDIALVIIEFEGKIFKLVNPIIIKTEGTIRMLEGCLSFPGLEIEVTRSKKVWVSALNEKNEPLEIEANDILAVIIQHEIDHINGKTFIARIPLWQRVKIVPQLQEIEKKTRHALSKPGKK
jgi:peptide deformylase